MPGITIRTQWGEIKTADQLFQIQRELFGGDQMIHADRTDYVLELDHERSQYLMDMLALVPDLGGFEPFQSWREHQRDQMPLQFGSSCTCSDETFSAMVD